MRDGKTELIQMIIIYKMAYCCYVDNAGHAKRYMHIPQ